MGASIESVLEQDYRELELVLVDDGSTDGSADLAASYAQRAPDRMQVVHHMGRKNCGMSASRNLGVAHSRGQYIAFLDADDLWLQSKTAEQVQILQEHPTADMVYGRTEIWHSWQGKDASEADHFCELGVEGNALYQPPQLFRQLLENRYQTPTTCNAMVRREVYERLGGFEGAFRGMYEDQVFFAKVHLGCTTYVSTKTWARYRQHREKLARKFSYAKYYRDRRQFLAWLADYSRSHGRYLTEDDHRLIAAELRRTQYPRLSAWQYWWRQFHGR